MKTKYLFILGLALINSVADLSSFAQGTAFTYQGRLEANGAPANGSYDFRLALYDALNGGNLSLPGAVTNSGVTVSNGLFTTAVDFGSVPFSGAVRWLDIGVRSNGSGAAFVALAPRQELRPTPYALFAAKAGVVTNGSVTAPQLQTTGPAAAGQILTYDGTSLVWQNPTATSGNWAVSGNSAADGNFLGTLNNLALDLRVNNARALRLEPNVTSPNVIAGFGGNLAGSGVTGGTVSGGGAGIYFGTPATNIVTDDFGVVGGGANNQAGNGIDSTTDGYFATVGGGAGNTASGISSTVGGGSANRASNNDTTVAGGYQNIVSGLRSAIGGGWANFASGSYACIGGGQINTNSADYTTVAGGLQNVASGLGATVGGGVDNTAGGINAVVPGGVNNIASGSSSFAAGANAQALHTGSFVWADAQSTPPPIPMGIPFSSIADNEFAIRAKGGVRFNTDTSLYFGDRTRQMLNLWGGEYAIGVQGFVEYYRSGGGFAWYLGGVHNDGTYDPGGGTTLMTLDSGSGLFLNTRASVCMLTIRGGCDLAEPFPMKEEEIEKGSVVVIDREHPGQLRRSSRAYDKRVAGIVSGANGIHSGISLHQEGILEGGKEVALTGRVYALADAGNGEIEPGDLLTTSNTPGHAMKVADQAKAQGAILGKAMSGLKDGKGLVLVLVTLQ